MQGCVAIVVLGIHIRSTETMMEKFEMLVRYQTQLHLQFLTHLVMYMYPQLETIHKIFRKNRCVFCNLQYTQLFPSSDCGTKMYFYNNDPF